MGIKCKIVDDVIIPPECRGKSETDRGIYDGTKSVMGKQKKIKVYKFIEKGMYIPMAYDLENIIKELTETAQPPPLTVEQPATMSVAKRLFG